MNLDDIHKEWSKDAPINEINLGTESLRIPMLMAKWQKIYATAQRSFNSINQNIKRVKKDKYLYYTGKMSEEELKEKGLEPFQFILKNDIELYMDADPQMLSLETEKLEQENIIKYIDYILRHLQWRHSVIKNSLEHQKFLSGA